MEDNIQQIYSFTFSGQFPKQPTFPKEQLRFASESDKELLNSIDFFEDGEVDTFVKDPSIYILYLNGEYIALGTMLLPYWRKDFVRTDLRDIGMHVSPKHRGKGFGRSIVQNLISICLENGNVPIAECLKENHASRATLESAGFVLSEE